MLSPGINTRDARNIAIHTRLWQVGGVRLCRWRSNHFAKTLIICCMHFIRTSLHLLGRALPRDPSLDQGSPACRRSPTRPTRSRQSGIGRETPSTSCVSKRVPFDCTYAWRASATQLPTLIQSPLIINSRGFRERAVKTRRTSFKPLSSSHRCV